MNVNVRSPETRDRIAKAKIILLHPEDIERLDDMTWSVPSQTTLGRYQVQVVRGEGRCSCPDFAARQEPCKHIFAVLSRFKGIDYTDSALSKHRRSYPQNSRAYNAGQAQEIRLFDGLLRDLVSGVPDFPRAPGAPGPDPAPMADQLYVAIQKVYTGLSARRALGVHDAAVERKLLARAPSFMGSIRLLNRPEVTAILSELVTLSALPLAGLEEGGAVSPDSTGVQTTQFGAWREEKHGEKESARELPNTIAQLHANLSW